MQQPSIYDLALELARKVGWRNVTRGPLFQLAKERGIVEPETDEKNWCKNLRGANSMSCIRSRLRTEPDVPDGSENGRDANSPAWREVNRDQILQSAYDLAASRGRLLIPRADVAEAAGVSPASVSKIWGSMDTLRLAVVARAKLEGPKKLVDQADAVGLTA